MLFPADGSSVLLRCSCAVRCAVPRLLTLPSLLSLLTHSKNPQLDNVMLKSEISQPRGYIAKLGDFGLAKVLGSSDALVNVSCTGTVNHLAPELFVPGMRITTAADTYAFGILLYELYMGGVNTYAGVFWAGWCC